MCAVGYVLLGIYAGCVLLGMCVECVVLSILYWVYCWVCVVECVLGHVVLSV